MINLKNAPVSGIVYALYLDKVLFSRYEDISEVESCIFPEKLLELHLFDSNKELRFVKTRKGKFIECEISDADEYDDTYIETSFVTSEGENKVDPNYKIQVINYLKYDENDMLHIVNYRLKEVW